MKKLIFVLSLLFFFPLQINADETYKHIIRTGELRWGAETSGGAPYVFWDVNNPKNVIGFEVEIMEEIAKELGVKPKLVVIPWDQLVPALMRKDFDVVFNGLEVTKSRQDTIDFTIPYYVFSEQITVSNTCNNINSFADLKNKKVGTLSATYAQNLLEAEGSIKTVPYPSTVDAFKDLDIGRLDAVMQDFPIATFYVKNFKNLKNTGAPVGEGFYAAAVRKDSPELKKQFDNALKKLIRNGTLERIYKKWGIWNTKQKLLLNYTDDKPVNGRKTSSLSKFIPLLLKGAGMTVILSCCSMSIAIVLGFLICSGKMYGGFVIKALCNMYVEIIRGTPLLIQLYILYYGLPNIGIQLNAFAAAIIGMGMNYAAYEAETYRAGLLSVSKGQEEAARSLGMSEGQTLFHIILPQAIKTILPPSTNDFIALFKDTSLVSIITVTELTRVYSQAATTTYKFLEIGLMTALLYFIMSFPLSLWSRSMEKRQHVHSN